MKKIFILLVVLLPVTSFAQSGLLNKLKQKVKDRGEQRLEEGMDKAIDKTEEEILKDKQKAKDGKENSVVKTDSKEQPASYTNLKSYSRYDFIPGENVLFAEDFSQDVVGEFPLKWLTNNRGEAVTIENQPNKWLRLFPASNFASPSFKNLPENFTVEMDLLIQFNGEGGYTYPNFEVRLAELAESDKSGRSYVVDKDAATEVALVLSPGGAGQPLQVSLNSHDRSGSYFSNQPKEIKTMSDNSGRPIHLSIWVQKERIRYWINSDKVFDIPQAVPPNSMFSRIGFGLESTIYTEEQLGVYVSNIKIAEGTPDTRNKLVTEGKFVTNGILFDVASDKIKPESAGVLKEIATVLQASPAIRVKVIGHTDSDGDDAKNLDLSRRRSMAVKAALSSEFGIDNSRMETDGFGESKPVAANTSKEGKAQNRRVEFIKL